MSYLPETSIVTMVKVRILILSTAFLLCLPVSQGFTAPKSELYSCKLDGTFTTYTKAEIGAVISAGGKCQHLKATDAATCVIGNLVQRYAVSDVETVLQEYPDALCMHDGSLIAKTDRL